MRIEIVTNTTLNSNPQLSRRGGYYIGTKQNVKDDFIKLKGTVKDRIEVGSVDILVGSLVSSIIRNRIVIHYEE